MIMFSSRYNTFRPVTKTAHHKEYSVCLLSKGPTPVTGVDGKDGFKICFI